MVGRHRRASTSSVETVDENQIQWRQETSVLKSVPKLSDNNTWPIFELRDAVILNKDGHTLENALYVASRGPFIVRGTLIIDDPSQKQHLIMKVRHSMPIEIRQSISYSIGEAEDGQPLLWVSGKGGWYEIVPSDSYLPIYNKTCEAATLYYRIMDIIKSEGPKRQKKGKRADTMTELSRIFHKYAAAIGDGSTLEEVIDRCKEHASFMISQIATEDQSEFDWETTLFYKWLAEVHDNSMDKTSLQSDHQLPPPQSPHQKTLSPFTHIAQTLPSRTREDSSTSSSPARYSSPQTESRSKINRQRSTRSHPTMQDERNQEKEMSEPATTTNTILPVGDPGTSGNSPTSQALGPTPPSAIEPQTPFESVLQAFEDVYEMTHESRQGMTVSATLTKIYFMYKFPNYREGGSGSYKLPVVEVLHYNAGELLKVIDKEKYEKHEVYAWLQELQEKQFDPIAINLWDFPYCLVPRGNRPRDSKASAGQPNQASKGPERDTSSNVSGPSSRAGKLPRGPYSGKKSSLRPKKRVHSELESDSETGEVEPITSQYFIDGEDMDLDDVDDASSPEDAQESDLIKIVLRADRMPSLIPNGPNETWICEEEDCGYVVRGIDVSDCEKRIKHHFLSHEDQAKRVNLAVAESRGQMPIKYAYFPPFLILVELHSPNSSPSSATLSPSTLTASPRNDCVPASALRNSTTLSASSSRPPSGTASKKASFRAHVNQFRRLPHPVSDRISKLTLP
ncbi:hypothetical protein BGZ63DRAFT_486843 [Mariannaea sp. PMI_226]|nr:hypothetical protein BGZ63DRAFT_486843 [Mariannaea sp. PMI_226]